MRLNRSLRAARALVALPLLAFGFAPSAAAAPGDGSDPSQDASAAQSQAKEVRGLRATPNRAVKSLALRPDQRAHHGDIRRGGKRPKCDKDVDLAGQLSTTLDSIAAQDNAICTNADIDVYTSGDASHVVQAGGEQAAWTHTDVSTPSAPQMLGQFKWSGRGGKATYTPDVKAFRQGATNYIVMGLERTSLAGYCGVVFVDVTVPASPVVVKQFIGTDWCDTHNVFVENDGSGEGQFVYATADRTYDMRVLAIKGTHGGSAASPASPVEIGRYRAPTANSDNYVHDMTVIDHGGTTGRRAYLAYWDSGLVVLDAADVTPGIDPTPLVGIDPPGFLAHHAYPNASGTHVFIEDEMTYTAGFEPVQMWDVSNTGAPAYVDGLTPDVGKNGELLPAHNLHVEGSTLYVGWYKAGLQAFPFTDAGFGARSAYHQVQTEASDDVYDGAWGVRLLDIGASKYVFQSDRRYGLIVDRLK